MRLSRWQDLFGHWAIALALGLAASGCNRGAPQVTGTVAFDAPAGLPATAVLEVTLQDVSRADAPAETLGITRVNAPKASPVSFDIEYDPAAIINTHDYAVRARIVDGEQLLFTSDTRYGVLTRGHGAFVALTLAKVAGRASPPPIVKGFFAIEHDGPWLIPCDGAGRIRVLPAGAFESLEHAYLAARRTAGEALLARVEGAAERDGFLVRRFLSIARDQDCDSP
jgi:uncharacterized lipoprotein YbaY